MEEIKNEAYKNAKIMKSRTKLFHDQFINRKTFVLEQKVMLYNSRLHLFAEKLKTSWSKSFVVHTVFTHSAVEIYDHMDDKVFKVNG